MVGAIWSTFFRDGRRVDGEAGEGDRSRCAHGARGPGPGLAHLGEFVPRDMVAVKVTGQQRAAIVAAPAYFESHPRPKTPRDLTGHRCLGHPMSAHGAVYRWEFEKRGTPVTVSVSGPLSLRAAPTRMAALDSSGERCEHRRSRTWRPGAAQSHLGPPVRGARHGTVEATDDIGEPVLLGRGRSGRRIHGDAPATHSAPGPRRARRLPPRRPVGRRQRAPGRVLGRGGYDGPRHPNRGSALYARLGRRGVEHGGLAAGRAL